VKDIWEIDVHELDFLGTDLGQKVEEEFGGRMEEVLVYHEHLIANVEPTECFPLVENVAKGIVEWQKSWLQERNT